MTRLAAVCSWVLGLGFGLPCAYGIRYLAVNGETWTFLGFPTYGDGPFTRVGIETTVPLLVAFLLVCVAEVLLGWVLWTRPGVGAWVGLALLPVELVFWIGFALPFGPLLGVVRTVAILVAVARSRASA